MKAQRLAIGGREMSDAGLRIISRGISSVATGYKKPSVASPPRLCLGAFLKPDVTPVHAEALQKLEASGPMLVAC